MMQGKGLAQCSLSSLRFQLPFLFHMAKKGAAGWPQHMQCTVNVELSTSCCCTALQLPSLWMTASGARKLTYSHYAGTEGSASAKAAV